MISQYKIGQLIIFQTKKPLWGGYLSQRCFIFFIPTVPPSFIRLRLGKWLRKH